VPTRVWIPRIISARNGKVLVSYWRTDFNTLLARAFLDQAPRTAIVFADSYGYFQTWTGSEPRTVYEDVHPTSLFITRLGEVTASATVTITSRDSAAKAGEDYAAINQNLSFAAFEQEKELLFEAFTDAVIEPNESFDLILTGISGVEMVSLPKRIVIKEGQAYFPQNGVKRLPDGSAEITVYLPDTGINRQIEVSSDLKTWSELLNSFGDPTWYPDDFYRFIDPSASNSPARFYRVQSGPTPRVRL
jgi:hypothetical protein